MKEERLSAMTKNYFDKKRTRQYAKARSMNYTEAKSMLQPQTVSDNQFDVRVGLDDIKSEIVEHPRVDMMKRSDGLGYMNGSLDADKIHSWLPLLDKLNHDKWTLSNIGPNYNVIEFSLRDEYERDDYGANITIGALSDSPPSEPATILSSMENSEGVSISQSFGNNQYDYEEVYLEDFASMQQWLDAVAAKLNKFAADHLSAVK